VELDQVGQSADFDSGEFHAVNEGRQNLGSITLAQQGESYTAQTLAAARRPSSVLDTLAFSSNQSPNGSAGQNWQPGLGTLGTGNGMSAENFDQSLNLKFLGGDQDAGLG
jgi:hypothetical protein